MAAPLPPSVPAKRNGTLRVSLPDNHCRRIHVKRKAHSRPSSERLTPRRPPAYPPPGWPAGTAPLPARCAPVALKRALDWRPSRTDGSSEQGMPETPQIPSLPSSDSGPEPALRALRCLLNPSLRPRLCHPPACRPRRQPSRLPMGRGLPERFLSSPKIVPGVTAANSSL